jgi:hypothetical protein
VYELHVKLFGVLHRVSSDGGKVRAGPRLKRMHVLDMEKDALPSETAGFEFKPILEKEVSP